MKNHQIIICMTILLLCLSSVCATANMAGHTEWAEVLNAADGTTLHNGRVLVHNPKRPNEIADSDDKDNAIKEYAEGMTYLWGFEVGKMLKTQWEPGDLHIAVLTKEENAGATNHKGYYSVSHHKLTAKQNDGFPWSQLRPIPIPTATIDNASVALEWTVPIEDNPDPEWHPNDDPMEHIEGYTLYRSTNPKSGFSPVTEQTVTAVKYLDTEVNPGTIYYYALGIVFQGGVESLVYSANSAPVLVAPQSAVVAAELDAPQVYIANLKNGDVVGSTPIISALASDASALSLNVELIIDGSTTVSIPVADIVTLNSSNTVASVNYSVVSALSRGKHDLKLLVRDTFGNVGSANVEIWTETKFVIRKVYNLPNPVIDLTEGTAFTYQLSQEAVDVVISVFNENGELIQEIEGAPGNEGFNRIAWDVKDKWGETLANDVYLYIIKAETAAGDKAVERGKLAVIR